MVDVTDKKVLSAVPKQPAAQLKELFSKNSITSDRIQDVAKKVLLPSQECEIWLNHLQTILENRHRGAKKAVETCRAKRKKATESGNSVQSQTITSEETEEDYFCGDCGRPYEEETADWFHCTCEQLLHPPPPEATYICLKCRN